MNIFQFIKCGGASLGGTFFPLAGELFCSDNKGETYTDVIKKLEYKNAILGSIIVSTTPAAVANVIDSYGHQYITGNQYLQYGLTALEASGLSLLLLSPLNSQEQVLEKITDTFGDLIKLSMAKNSLMIKAVVLGAGAQAVAFKYILSDSEETSFELGLEGALEPIL
jgi:hypothetical protein